MPAPGIFLTAMRPSAPASSSRADIACFAGLVARRGNGDDLLGVPVRLESWSDFDRQFDWTARTSVPGAGDRVPTALGLALRQFFLQGGATAWVVRCGDPLALADPAASPEEFRAARLTALAGGGPESDQRIPILPGLAGRSRSADPLDPASWLGAAAIFGIDEAAMLVVPDLVDLCADPLDPVPEIEPELGPPEHWRPCAPPIAEDEAPPTREALPAFLAPRFGKQAFRRWSDAVAHCLAMLGRPRGPAHRRDVMLVAALPLPAQSEELPDRIASWPLPVLDRSGFAGTDGKPHAMFDAAAIGNARLQLGYPWLATPQAAACPEGLQSPEGTLAGILARSALEKGAFRSAANSPVRGPTRLYPTLSLSDRNRGFERPAGAEGEFPIGRADWLGDRLCLFDTRRGGVSLISDATFAQDRAWRPGGISRLIGIVLRAARHLGDDLVFEPSGPHLWRRCADRMTAILERLRAMGAFSGASARDSYLVACDRSTMTPGDVDAGRVRCDVVLNPASPIHRIEVKLALIEPVAAASQREAA